MAHGDLVADGSVAVLRADKEAAKGGEDHAGHEDEEHVAVVQRDGGPLPLGVNAHRQFEYADAEHHRHRHPEGRAAPETVEIGPQEEVYA